MGCRSSAYVHKILTGRKSKFPTLRQYKGISGFPDKNESVYDPFTCGHSGNAISAALGMACADAILGYKRSVVAVVGDGAIGAGMSLEALNHAGDLKKNVLVVLNDNEMSISNTVGAFSKYLNKIRTAPLFADLKKEARNLLNLLPVFGKPVEKTLEHIVELIRKGAAPGQIFVELGFNYFGPIDGHDFRILIETLNDIKHLEARCFSMWQLKKAVDLNRRVRIQLNTIAPASLKCATEKLNSPLTMPKEFLTQIFSEIPS